MATRIPMAVAEPAVLQPLQRRPESYVSRSLRSLRRNHVALLGLLVVCLILLIVALAAWVAPYDPISQVLANRLKPPSSDHWFGTDEYGRDILSRVIWGGRSSLLIGFLSTLLAAAIGTVVGIVAGYAGGIVDTVLMRVMDWLMAFPLFLLALIVIATLGKGEANVILAIGISAVPRFARVLRSQTLSLRHEVYVDAARVVGCKVDRILLTHIFPNASSVVIVLFSLYLATAIQVEASLSFLGLGTAPPAPSWGLMVASSRGLLLSAPWTLFFPGLAITLTVLSLNLFGDGLRDALDPTLS